MLTTTYGPPETANATRAAALGWRSHPLDGSMLWFQPATGLNVRWDGPETRALHRTAPRIVMFGITNRCNLDCHFCSRDRDAASAWTVESAYTMLSGLARAGVLEVAFGGGEPLAFRGFEHLIQRLGQDTPLALHFTTNGTLLTSERLTELAPWVGEIRLSIYDDNPWPERVELLAAAGVRFGTNVLVTPARLSALPALLRRLAWLGCRDVALLSYVGPEPELHLGADDELRLARMIADSPIQARLSVCFGDRLDPLPRLLDGVEGDCGAGHDFVVLTSERTLKACSFHDEAFAVATANDVLCAWRDRRSILLGAARRSGCARGAGRRGGPVSNGVRVWQGFSGNNSGDCVLVGRFERVEDARKYVADLLPGFVPSEPFAQSWKALLESEGIAPAKIEHSPDVIATAGQAVMLHTYSATNDDFPSLREMLWKRGGRAVYTGIHEHDPIMMVAGVGCPNPVAVDAVDVDLETAELHAFQRRGLDLIAVLPVSGAGSEAADARIAQLERIAGMHGAGVAAELIALQQPANLPAALAARPIVGVERLWAHFPSPETAASFARGLDGKVAQVDHHVIVEGEHIGPRLGQLVHRRGGVATLIEGPVMRLVPTFWRETKKRGNVSREQLDPAELGAALLPRLRPFLEQDFTPYFRSEWTSVTGAVDTARPGDVLAALSDFARSEQLQMWIAAEPRDRVVGAIARVANDLHALRIKR